MTRLLQTAALALAALAGQAAAQIAPPAAPAGQAAAPAPVVCMVTAVCGVNPPVAVPPEDARLAALETALKPLGFAGYEFIGSNAQELQEGKEARFPINGMYSAAVTLLPAQGADAAALDVRVEALLEGKIVTALAGTVQARPGETVVFRGMPLAPGELVVLLTRPSDQQSGQSGKDQQQQDQDKQDQDKQDQQEQAQQDKQESEQNRQEEKQEEKQDQQSADPSDDDHSGEQQDGTAEEKKEDMENGSLRALLESLEETDKREQKEIRNVRERIDFKGGWW